MEIYYHDYMLSISIFGYVFVSTCCIESLYRKTSMGETHRDAEIKLDWEIHELWKLINHGPCMTKWALNSHHGGPPSLLLRQPDLSLCFLALCFVHGQVCAQYTLFSYVSLSVSNRIKNHMIKQLET
jgi:hypothetical protein